MKKSSLISLIGSLVVFVVVLAGYWFCYSVVTAKSVQASELAAQIATQNSAAAQLIQAKSELSGLATQESTINQYFVQTNNVVPFLEQLQSLGNYLGANVQVVSVSAVPGTPYGTLDLSLSITGSFSSVEKTLGAIEYEPYNISISTLSLTDTLPAGSASSTPEWSAAAQFTVGAQTGSTASSTTP
jgi:Tfp pilus assembly protein PilO